MDTHRNSRLGALTIVSKNYISTARVLCESFLAHHPGARFFVVLVDENDGAIDPAKEAFTLLTVDDIPLPRRDNFLFHYSILELNTAVKPYSLAYLLSTHDLDKLAYIDPDICVYRPMDAVWDGLDDHDVVLTPHMRRPFHDDKHPAEIGILQSGTYNLGFVGLRRCPEVMEMLEWWMEKLYLDCVVDIPNGLFTDQKWMDLIPGYIARTLVLRDPTYNVAYWNLHERVLTQDRDAFLVDGTPLTFFHFSGYSPKQPQKLSKHQSRHDLVDLPVVRALCDAYAADLARHGFAETSRWKYAFAKLADGVRVGGAIQWVGRYCERNCIDLPNPRTDAQAFSRFLMTPNAKMPGGRTPPIVAGLRFVRSDVAAAFPRSAFDHRDEAFENWFKSSGVREENFAELVANHWDDWEREPVVARALAVLDRRPDLRRLFGDVVTRPSAYYQYANWMQAHGTREEDFTDADVLAFRTARNGYGKVLHLYFCRPDLQESFPDLHAREGREPFLSWLLQNLAKLPDISESQMDWFGVVADQSESELLALNLTYNGALRARVGAAFSMFSALDYRERVCPSVEAHVFDGVLKWLGSEDGISPLQQLASHYAADRGLRAAHPAPFASRDALVDLAEDALRDARLPPGSHRTAFGDALLGAAEAFDPSVPTVTVAGYFDAPTGMGQSAHSLATALECAGVRVARVTLPAPLVEEVAFDHKADVRLAFGWPAAGSSTLYVVANADAAPAARRFLPPSALLADQEVGYWVWETEELPASQAKAAKGFDRILTPSEFSKAAIEKHAGVPVEVVPHVIDAAALATVKPSRATFGLADDVTVFGTFFDPRSYIERKNPLGVVRAFRDAFGDRADVLLVLKVNALARGAFDAERFRSQCDYRNVRIIDGTWDRQTTLRLLASMDVYVSLHRAEGFGLVLAEAMAVGVATIATGYSGNVDFSDASACELVPATRVRTRRTFGAYPAGSTWGEPDLAAAASAMKRCLDAGHRAKLVAAGQALVRARLDPTKVGKAMRALGL